MAGTVIEVATWRGCPRVTVREDTATRTDSNGMSESQEYAYSPNPDGSTHHFVLKDGIWRNANESEEAKGRFTLAPKNSGYGITFGTRHHHHDYSF